MFRNKLHFNEQGADKNAPKIPQHPAFGSPSPARKNDEGTLSPIQVKRKTALILSEQRRPFHPRSNANKVNFAYFLSWMVCGTHGSCSIPLSP